MGNNLTPACDSCHKQKEIGNTAEGLPSMIGFEMEDGSTINLCSDCLMAIGRMDEIEKNNFFERILRR